MYSEQPAARAQNLLALPVGHAHVEAVRVGAVGAVPAGEGASGDPL
jgi:hypothetical protein